MTKVKELKSKPLTKVSPLFDATELIVLNERQETMLVQFWLKKNAFIKSERGATAIEYGLIAAGIAVAISAVVFVVGTDLAGLFSGIGNQLATAAANI